MKYFRLSTIAVIALLVFLWSNNQPISASSPHVPGIIFHHSFVEQTGNLPSLFTAVAPPEGADYRISFYVYSDSGDNSGSVVATFDDGSPSPKTFGCAFSLAQAQGSMCIVHSAPGTTLDLSVEGFQNSPYNLFVTVEEL